MIGFPNTGNSCFFNAATQFLIQVPFIHFILDTWWRRYQAQKKSSLTLLQRAQMKDPADIICWSMLKKSVKHVDALIQFMYSLNSLQNKKNDFNEVKEEIVKLRQSLNRLCPCFNNFEQHDSSECLLKMFDLIEAALVLFEMRSALKAMRQALTGRLKYTRTCSECHFVKKSKEDVYILPIQLKGDTLFRCIEATYEDEEIEDVECDKEDGGCGARCLYFVETQMTRTPVCLMLCLQRYTPPDTQMQEKQSRFFKQSQSQYLRKKTQVPFYIQTDDTSPAHELKAAVIHYGNSPQSGHYTAARFNISESDNSETQAGNQAETQAGNQAGTQASPSVEIADDAHVRSVAMIEDNHLNAVQTMLDKEAYVLMYSIQF